MDGSTGDPSTVSPQVRPVTGRLSATAGTRRGSDVPPETSQRDPTTPDRGELLGGLRRTPEPDGHYVGQGTSPTLRGVFVDDKHFAGRPVPPCCGCAPSFSVGQEVNLQR